MSRYKPYRPKPQIDRPNSSLAVASFVLSLLSLILGPLGYIPGIICGHLARRRLRRNAGLRGAGFAKAGLIIGYLGLALTIALVGLITPGMSELLRALAAGDKAVSTSGSDGNAAAAPMLVGPSPVSVSVHNFRPKADGKKGGFTLVIANRANQPAEWLEGRFEYRDADGVIEDERSFLKPLTLPPNALTKEEEDDFFMRPTTRSVTVSVGDVTLADGSKWDRSNAALAASDPGPLSFPGHAAPASAEVIRFGLISISSRPDQLKQGKVDARLVNHSNKAIKEFHFEMFTLDATGMKTRREGYSLWFPFLDWWIEPGGMYEFSRVFNFMDPAARSATIVARKLTFADGEEWVAAKE